jgi:DNA-binding CsgD family transcriptional regulator
MLEELEISESQLRTIVGSILDKTGFDNISQFAVYAVGRGLIVPDTNPS